MPRAPARGLAALITLLALHASIAVALRARPAGSCPGAVHAVYAQVAGTGGQRRWEARAAVGCRRTGPVRFLVAWRSSPSREQYATVIYTLHHYYVGVIHLRSGHAHR